MLSWPLSDDVTNEQIRKLLYQKPGNVASDILYRGFDEETVIYWKAVTYEGGAAIAANCSPWSEIISFAVHEKPGLTVRIKDIGENSETNDLPVVGSYPIKYVTETTYFDSHYNEILVTSMSFKVLSRQSYRRLDRYGNPVVIKAGDVLYSIIDVEDPRDKERTIAASDITLDNGVWYTLEATVTLNNGSSAVNTFDFAVNMGAKDYIIECTGSVNPNDVSLNLIPAAVKYEGGGFSPPGDTIPFGSDGSSLWTGNGKLYYSWSKVYDPETGVISDTDWDPYVGADELVSGQFWQSSDGRLRGVAGQSPVIFNEQTGLWEADTRSMPFGSSSEPIYRSKVSKDYSLTEYFDVLFFANAVGDIGLYVFEDGDWSQIPESDIQSELQESAIGSVVGALIWNTVHDGQKMSILSDGFKTYIFAIRENDSPPVLIYNASYLFAKS